MCVFVKRSDGALWVQEKKNQFIKKKRESKEICRHHQSCLRWICFLCCATTSGGFNRIFVVAVKRRQVQKLVKRKNYRKKKTRKFIIFILLNKTGFSTSTNLLFVRFVYCLHTIWFSLFCVAAEKWKNGFEKSKRQFRAYVW